MDEREHDERPWGSYTVLDDAASFFIEVQTGESFGEDDIERLEDDFGRS